MIENKPTIYNTPTIYNQGNKKNYVKFGGLIYEYVKIGKLYWTTENLKNYTSGALFYNNSSDYSYLGYLYPTIDIISDTNTQSSFIQNLVHDGWRVPTREDFETLLNYPLEELKDKLNSWPSNGNDKTGFNCYKSGFRGVGGSWVPDSSVFISQSLERGGIAYYFNVTNLDRTVQTNVDALTVEGQRLRSVRFCKDV
ncbi:MAG: FISUMP domain-containing protein [Alphaproteobacteria bacterium]